MSQTQDTIIAALMEQLIAEGPDGVAQVFTALFNLAMRLERERFLGAGLYERSPDRRGYANGYKPKKLDTTAGTVTVDVPKAAGTGEAFYPQSLERGRRSSRAVMLAIAEMYVQGGSIGGRHNGGQGRLARPGGMRRRSYGCTGPAERSLDIGPVPAAGTGRM